MSDLHTIWVEATNGEFYGIEGSFYDNDMPRIFRAIKKTGKSAEELFIAMQTHDTFYIDEYKNLTFVNLFADEISSLKRANSIEEISLAEDYDSKISYLVKKDGSILIKSTIAEISDFTDPNRLMFFYLNEEQDNERAYLLVGLEGVEENSKLLNFQEVMNKID